MLEKRLIDRFLQGFNKFKTYFMFILAKMDMKEKIPELLAS